MEQHQARHDFKRRRDLQQIAIRRDNRRNIFAQRRLSIANQQDWARLDQMRHRSQEQEIEEQKELQAAEQQRICEGEEQQVQAREWQMDNQLTIIVDHELQTTIRELFARKACPADLAQAINDINDTQDAFKLHHGVITIRKLLSRIYNEDIIEELRESEAIVVLHRLIDQQVFKQLQLQAQWALANISYSDRYCDELIELGTLDLMIRVLKQKQKYFINTAVVTIGNICFSSAVGQKIAMESQVIDDIIDIASDTQGRKLFDDCLWTAVNLCKSLTLAGHPKEVKAFFVLACEAIQPGFLRDGDTFELCLNYIYCFTREFMKEMVQLGLTRRLISLCRRAKGKQEKYSQRFTAIKILSVLSEGDEEITDVLIKEGILDALMQLLLEIDERLVIQALYTLSNLAASNKDHADQIFNHDQLLTTCRILMDNQCFTYDVCYVFTNLSMSGNPERVIKFYESIDAITIISKLLSEENIDDELLKVALQLLARVLTLGQTPQMKKEGKNTARESFIRSGALDSLVHVIEDKENHDTIVTTLAKSILIDFFLEFSELEG